MPIKLGTLQLVLLFLICAVMLVSPVGDLQHDRLLSRLLDFGHFPLFAVVFYCVLGFLPRKTTGSRRWGVAVVATLLFNLIAECMQPLFGRSSGLADWFIGCAGCLSAALLNLPKEAGYTFIRCTVVSSLLLVSLLPVGMVVFDRYAARTGFPLLSSFESPLELDRWQCHGCTIRRSRKNATDGCYALKIKTEKKASYPGLFLVDMSRNWSDMESLRFDVFWPQDAGARLWVRIDDVPCPAFGDRVQVAIPLHPGTNRIMLSRELVSTTSGGKALDLKAIQSFGLFLENGGPSLVFHLDNVALNLK